MCLRMLIAICISWAGTLLSGQQALFVSPGGIVALNKNSISITNKELSADEMTFKYGGRVYPNGGSVFVEMIKQNSIKYNVLDHIRTKDRKIWFDGSIIDVGVQVLSLDVALRWGEQIACLGLIPHTKMNWLEPNNAYALIIFSPKTGKGGHKGLYLEGKGSSNLWLLDPIDKKQINPSHLKARKHNLFRQP